MLSSGHVHHWSVYDRAGGGYQGEYKIQYGHDHCESKRVCLCVAGRLGSGTVHPNNLSPIFPRGVSGMVYGAGLVFLPIWTLT
jgi:hypothetical protein